MFDIATMVTFWEAMTILVVRNREQKKYLDSLVGSFHSISFLKNEEIK